jgi:hypothetical protein
MTNVYCCIHFGLELAPSGRSGRCPASSPIRAQLGDRHASPGLHRLLRSGLFEATGIALPIWSVSDWLKFKNPEASTVGRETEEHWSR